MYSFECYSLLKQCFQKEHSYKLAWYLPLQLRHLNEWGQGSPFFVSNLGGLVFSLALQHHVKVTIVFSEIETITFHTFSFLNMTYSCHMSPLPTVLILWYAWIHIYISNCCDVATNIESSVNDFLSIWSVLSIPNVYPNDGHVGLGRYLDDMRFWCKDNVVE